MPFSVTKTIRTHDPTPTPDDGVAAQETKAHTEHAHCTLQRTAATLARTMGALRQPACRISHPRRAVRGGTTDMLGRVTRGTDGNHRWNPAKKPPEQRHAHYSTRKKSDIISAGPGRCHVQRIAPCLARRAGKAEVCEQIGKHAPEPI